MEQWLHHTQIAALTALAAAGLFLGGQATHDVDASSHKSIGTVNYVKNYGPAFWKQSGKKLVPLGKTLKTGTTWKVFTMQKYGKDYLFDMGGRQMANSRYLDLYQENSSQSLKAVAKIHYTPGYGIAVWNKPNGKALNKKLKHGTSWKAFGRKVVNGHVWYNLGGNQWFDSKYADIVKETSRGVKTYATGAPKLIKPIKVMKSNTYGKNEFPSTDFTSHETVTLDYNPHFKPNIEKEREYFGQYLNQLHQLNGKPGVTFAGEQMAYAQSRAEINNGMDHSGLGGGYAECLATAIWAYNPGHANSDQEVAYQLLMEWYDDTNNMNPGFGHRNIINYAYGNGGIGIDAKTGKAAYDLLEFPGPMSTAEVNEIYNVHLQGSPAMPSVPLPSLTFHYID